MLFFFFALTNLASTLQNVNFEIRSYAALKHFLAQQIQSVYVESTAQRFLFSMFSDEFTPAVASKMIKNNPFKGNRNGTIVFAAQIF